MSEMNAYIAVQQQQSVKPSFTVQRLSGEVDHTVHIFDKKENKILSKVTRVPAGFLVKFAKGHSIRCINEDHLKMIGAGLSMVPVVDIETGEIKGAIKNEIVLSSAAA